MPSKYSCKVLFLVHNVLNGLFCKFYREKIHGFEYPVGERIIVKLSDMSSAHIDTTFIESMKPN